MGMGMLCFVTVQRDRQRPLRSRSTLSSPAGLRSLSTPSALRVGDSPLSQRACRKRAQAPLRAQSPRCSKRLSGEALTAVAQRISEVSWQRMTKCGFVTLARYRVAVPNRGIVGNDKEKPKELRRHRGGDEDAHCSQSSSTSPSRMRLPPPQRCSARMRSQSWPERWQSSAKRAPIPDTDWWHEGRLRARGVSSLKAAMTQ